MILKAVPVNKSPSRHCDPCESRGKQSRLKNCHPERKRMISFTSFEILQRKRFRMTIVGLPRRTFGSPRNDENLCDLRALRGKNLKDTTKSRSKSHPYSSYTQSAYAGGLCEQSRILSAAV